MDDWTIEPTRVEKTTALLREAVSSLKKAMLNELEYGDDLNLIVPIGKIGVDLNKLIDDID